MSRFYELTPAYGRDYKTAKEAKEDWASGKDFVGDHQLNFQYVNIESIPKPCTAMLRYKCKTMVTSVKEKGAIGKEAS
jgi:hypothetical protein